MQIQRKSFFLPIIIGFFNIGLGVLPVKVALLLRRNYLATMTITEKEIREDFRRFIRHESMRANIKEDELLGILKLKTIEQ